MRRRGEIYNLIEQRNKELYDTYKNVISSGEVLSNKEYFEKIVNSPTSRFFVDLPNTVNVIKNMMAGTATFVVDTKREMYEEILRRTRFFMELFPSRTLSRIVNMVIKQHAPRFYMSPKSAEVIVCRIKKEKRCRKYLR